MMVTPERNLFTMFLAIGEMAGPILLQPFLATPVGAFGAKTV
jgi:hypothetical protein